MADAPAHIPVLLSETLALLAPAAGETFLDATAGAGGHAAAIAPLLGPRGTIVLNDFDPANLDAAHARLESVPNRPLIVTLRGNFADAPRRLAEQGLAADLVLADLGFSSDQMSDAARGLSFMRDGPLDMRLNPDLETSAADLVNSLPEQELARLIREYGEDRDAPRIARKLVASRKSKPITSTGQLAELVRSVSGPRGQSIDPATRTFQALRIAVNDELGSLGALLAAVERAASGQVRVGSPPTWLRPGARVAIISFHSLEDRQVKEMTARLDDQGLAKPLTRKPVTAGDDELSRNPRSRSAKLRVVRIEGEPADGRA